MKPELAVDTYNMVRLTAADLCDVVAVRTSLLVRMGDVWSTTAHRLRDDQGRWMLHDHTEEWKAYNRAVEHPVGIFADALGSVALMEHLGFYPVAVALPDEAPDDPRVAFALQSIAAILGYVVAPALGTWTCSAVAATCAGWIPEIHSAEAAEALRSDIGDAMATAVDRVAFAPDPVRGRAPLIGATALSLRRMLDHPDDGAFLANMELEVKSVLTRLEDVA